MIEAVQEYDPRKAAGILSGLALSLGRPTLEFRTDHGKNEVEQRILAELRKTLNLDPRDHSLEAVERLADALDEEAARIAGIEQEPNIIERLSREGLLPSDVFEVAFDPQLSTNYGSHWNIERELAELTIRHPHREQNFAPKNSPSGVSIFARFFTHKFPARSFWLVTTGLRQGTRLHVGQVFRVYPQDIDLSNCETLTDVLKVFANIFGLEIELNGKLGKFFMFVETDNADTIQHHIKLPKYFHGRTVISGLTQKLENKATFQLVFAINLIAYFRSIEAKHGWDSDILNYLK